MENNVLIQFGSRIKFFRTQAGFSQEKLAELTGFHRTYIGLVENGKRNISLKNIEVFAKTFGISISELMKNYNNGG